MGWSADTEFNKVIDYEINKKNMSEKKGYEQLPNDLKLFVNNKKTKDSHPDYTGKYFDENLEEYYVSCWTNTSKTGNTYLSGKMIKASEAKAKWNKEKNMGTPISEAKTVTDSGDKELDDSLPF